MHFDRISQSQKLNIIYLKASINVFFCCRSSNSLGVYDNAAGVFPVDDSVADDDLVFTVQHYENSTAQDDNTSMPSHNLTNNNNNNNNNSNNSNIGDNSNMDNMDVDEQGYCLLTDDDIISATREFHILAKSSSSPVKKYILT